MTSLFLFFFLAFLRSCVIVTCSCGHSWCFQCKLNAHWPASCAQNKVFQEARSKFAKRFEKFASDTIVRATCSQCDASSSRKNNQRFDVTGTCSKCSHRLCENCFKFREFQDILKLSSAQIKVQLPSYLFSNLIVHMIIFIFNL